MIGKKMQQKIQEKKELLAEINSAILAYDPILREKARDILLAEVFGLDANANRGNGHGPSDEFLLAGAKPTSLQELIKRWPATTQASRALLSAYHLQVNLGYRSITGRQIQNNLKKLGLRLTNVTVATRLNEKTEPPRLKKTNSRGRRGYQYAVTGTGIRFVENRLNGVEG